jgi:predicted dehydrogenase
MKRYNVGIIGYGWAAEAHIPAIHATSLAQVTAICSSRPLDARELSAKHGCPLKVYHEVPALLADPDIHVVSICSYHKQHPEQVIAAARTDKHIIVEKPLAFSLDDLRAVEQEVRRAAMRWMRCCCASVTTSKKSSPTAASRPIQPTRPTSIHPAP